MLTFTDDAFKASIEEETGIKPEWAAEAFSDLDGGRPPVDRADQGVAVHPPQGLDPRLRLRGRDRAAARGLLTAHPPSARARGRPPPAGCWSAGRRCRCGIPRADDAPALFALAGDPEVTRFFSWGPYRRLEEAERVAGDAARPPRRRRGTGAGGGRRLPTRPIGITLLSELSRRDRRAIVGTWLGRAHWGTGANRETKALDMPPGLRARSGWSASGPTRMCATLALRRRSSGSASRVRASCGAFTAIAVTPATSRSTRCCARSGSGRDLAGLPVRIDGAPPEAFAPFSAHQRRAAR